MPNGARVVIIVNLDESVKSGPLLLCVSRLGAARHLSAETLLATRFKPCPPLLFTHGCHPLLTPSSISCFTPRYFLKNVKAITKITSSAEEPSRLPGRTWVFPLTTSESSTPRALPPSS